MLRDLANVHTWTVGPATMAASAHRAGAATVDWADGPMAATFAVRAMCLPLWRSRMRTGDGSMLALSMIVQWRCL